MAKVHLKLKDTDQALVLLNRILLLFETLNTDLDEQRGFVYLEIAAIYKRKNEITNAIDFQQRAYDFFIEYDQTG